MSQIIVANHYLTAVAFNPLTSITWDHAYYAEGPEFIAKGVANGGALGDTGAEVPDEIGTYDLVQAVAGARPTYQAAGLNSQPSFRFDGGDNVNKSGTTWTQINAPFTVACVFKISSLTQGVAQCVFDGENTARRAAVLTLTTATPDSWWIYNGSGTVNAGTADTTQHLAIATFDSTDDLTLDGSSVASGNAGTNVSQGVVLGAAFNGSSPFTGDIAFWAIKGSTLTADEKAALRTWSQGKYGTA
jgi:hypothetical protein